MISALCSTANTAEFRLCATRLWSICFMGVSATGMAARFGLRMWLFSSTSCACLGLSNCAWTEKMKYLTTVLSVLDFVERPTPHLLVLRAYARLGARVRLQLKLACVVQRICTRSAWEHKHTRGSAVSHCHDWAFHGQTGLHTEGPYSLFA